MCFEGHLNLCLSLALRPSTHFPCPTLQLLHRLRQEGTNTSGWLVGENVLELGADDVVIPAHFELVIGVE